MRVETYNTAREFPFHLRAAPNLPVDITLSRIIKRIAEMMCCLSKLNVASTRHLSLDISASNAPVAWALHQNFSRRY